MIWLWGLVWVVILLLGGVTAIVLRIRERDQGAQGGREPAPPAAVGADGFPSHLEAEPPVVINPAAERPAEVVAPLRPLSAIDAPVVGAPLAPGPEERSTVAPSLPGTPVHDGDDRLSPAAEASRSQIGLKSGAVAGIVLTLRFGVLRGTVGGVLVGAAAHRIARWTPQSWVGGGRAGS